jgi:hypothetical protein
MHKTIKSKNKDRKRKNKSACTTKFVSENAGHVILTIQTKTSEKTSLLAGCCET